MIRACDFSNYTGEVTETTLAALRALNVRLVIVRLGLDSAPLDLSLRQIDALLAAGFAVQVYLWCYFTTDDPRGLIQRAKAALGDRPVWCYWLDCEEGRYVGAPQANADWLYRAVQACHGQGVVVGIYSARWWWQPYLGDTAEFADLWLWVATLDGNEDLATWPRFGGWDHAIGKQFSSSTPGIANADQSWFEEAVLTNPLTTTDQDVVDSLKTYLGEMGAEQGSVIQALDAELRKHAPGKAQVQAIRDRLVALYHEAVG